MPDTTHSLNIKDELVCPVCDSTEIDKSISECPPICVECGYVIRPDHENSPPIHASMGGHSEVVNEGTWAETHRIANATEKRLAEAFEILETLANIVRIPIPIRRETAEIYSKAFLAETTDGRKTAAIVAACVRLASLQARQPIPEDRLIAALHITSGQFHQSCSILREDLDHAPAPPDPADYVAFLDNDLAPDEEVLRSTVQMLDKVTGAQCLVGKDPSGIAAAALYLSGEQFTQSDVADAIGMSTETIRNRVAELRELDTDG